MMIRKQIWNTLIDTKFKEYILSDLVKSYQKRERYLNVFLAIASSTSIAAWALWDILPKLWAFIIALSQVITVVKPYFPFSKYVQELNSKAQKTELLNIELELLWNKMQRNVITENEAEQLYYDYRKQIVNILSFSDETVLDVNSKRESLANVKMKNFIKINYGIVININ